MKRLVDSGAEVWAGWSVTNAVRESEATAAMQSIGIPPERLFFHRMPDKGACAHLRELSAKWADAISTANPERLVAGAFECGHIDHDATNWAVAKAAQGALPILEVPLYHTYLTRIPKLNRFAEPRGEEILYLSPEEWRLKKRFSRMYPSQNIGSLLVWYTVLGWAKGRPPALCRTERLRLQTHFDFLTPNLPENLKAKVLSSPIWKRWSDAIKTADEL